MPNPPEDHNESKRAVYFLQPFHIAHLHSTAALAQTLHGCTVPRSRKMHCAPGLVVPARAAPVGVRRRATLYVTCQLAALFSFAVQGAAPQQVYRVLAFGDSLTEGYYAQGSKFHPYTKRMQHLLNTNAKDGEPSWEVCARQAFWCRGALDVGTECRRRLSTGVWATGPWTGVVLASISPRSPCTRSACCILATLCAVRARAPFQVVNAGKSGERAITGMTQRLPQLLQEAEARGSKYDFVIVEGGINDLLNGGEVAPTFKALQQLWDASLAHKAQVLACTLLPTKIAAVEEKRSTINHQIRQYVSSQRGLNSRLHLLDMDKMSELHFVGASDWDDEVHPSAAGYDHIGDFSFIRIKMLANKISNQWSWWRRRRHAA